MGNNVPKLGKMSTASASVGTTKVNIDDIDLHGLDETKSNHKEDKKTRKSKEYKLLRTMARTGIDKERRFQLWTKATNATPQYASMYETIKEDLFQDIDMNDFPQFPRFGSACTFDKLSTVQQQQHEQQQDNDKDHINLLHASQRILLVLAIEHDSLKYCPQLGYIVELMLMDEYATECGVFSICHSMLVASKRNNWYFRTDYFNSYVRIKTFLSIFEDNVSLVASHLKANHMDISNMLGDAISSMFVQYLNDQTFQRLVDTFTVEGYKILFRVGVAILNYAQSQLVQCKDLSLFQRILITESKKLSPEELCKRCFKIYLTRNKFEKLDKFHRDKGFDDKFLGKIEDETYVRRWPTWDKQIMSKSQILNQKVQFLQLWVWLPPGCHIGDYNLLFSTQDDGYKLSSLYMKCQEQTNLLIIIKTTNKEIIGCFVQQLDDPEDIDNFPPLKKRIKDPKILLFKLASNDNGKNNDSPKNDENIDNNGQTEDDKDIKESKFEPQCYWANTADQFYHQSNFQLKNMHTQRELELPALDDGDENEDDTNEEKKTEDEEDDKDMDMEVKEQRIPIVFPSKESLIIGDGEQNCIFLDNDLNYGFSSKCATFNAPSLVTDKDGQFQVSQVEVWCVD